MIKSSVIPGSASYGTDRLANINWETKTSVKTLHHQAWRQCWIESYWSNWDVSNINRHAKQVPSGRHHDKLFYQIGTVVLHSTAISTNVLFASNTSIVDLWLKVCREYQVVGCSFHNSIQKFIPVSTDNRTIVTHSNNVSFWHA